MAFWSLSKSLRHNARHPQIDGEEVYFGYISVISVLAWLVGSSRKQYGGRGLWKTASHIMVDRRQRDEERSKLFWDPPPLIHLFQPEPPPPNVTFSYKFP